ncbi:hypothetical protein [Streptomyces sp. NPDC052496]|uniref:hypothetical protein n=1 Tax=Streptomyces sp. NPDC052496 TaxID=3154951 RepID=UPI00342C8F21
MREASSAENRPPDQIAAEQVAMMVEAALRARACLEVQDARGAFEAACAAQTAGSAASGALVSVMARRRLAARGLAEAPNPPPAETGGETAGGVPTE